MDRKFWLFLADTVCHSHGYTSRHHIAQGQEAVRKHLDALDETDLKVAVVEAICLDHMMDYHGNVEEQIKEVCAQFGVDLQKLEQEAKQAK